MSVAWTKAAELMLRSSHAVADGQDYQVDMDAVMTSNLHGHMTARPWMFPACTVDMLSNMDDASNMWQNVGR